MNPSREEVRKKFPSLNSGFAFLENAGGSQVPATVASGAYNHMLSDYVQLGAGYDQSLRATQVVADAHTLAADLLNTGDQGLTLLGASTTELIHRVAKAYGQVLQPGDEVIIAESNHEANAGAWEELARLGITVRNWAVDPETLVGDPLVLAKMLCEKTRIVAMPHVSNIVGKIEPVKQACELAHQWGAKVFVDGVAFAPHRAVDVEALGADWYVFSLYKVYGPHMAAMFARHSALAPLTGPNHHFIPKDSPYKWELGGVSHEGCAGFLGLKPYLAFLADEEYRGRSTIEKAYEVMETLESPVEARFRDWVASRQDLRMIGSKSGGKDTVGTVSFLHKTLASNEISARADQAAIGIRHGNMYAVRLLDALEISRDPGVVRVSMVHYNTVEEVDRLINVLEEFLLSTSVPKGSS